MISSSISHKFKIAPKAWKVAFIINKHNNYIKYTYSNIRGNIMPLVTNKEVLDAANEGGYAVGAFNINNMEIVQSIVTTASEMNAPVILAASQGAISYAGIE